MDDIAADLMWDGATRDREREERDFARAAALADAEPGLWPLVAQAADERDLGHRLGLAEGAVRVIASRRGYSAAELVADLKRRWEILVEARAAAAPPPAPAPAGATYEEKLRAAARRRDAYLHEVGVLTARTARRNPGMPLAQCQAAAEEALTKQADAFPLAYDSFGHVGDGPLTRALKNWTPPNLPVVPSPAARPGAAPAPGGGAPAPPAPSASPFSHPPAGQAPVANPYRAPGAPGFSHAPGGHAPLRPLPQGHVPAVPGFSSPSAPQSAPHVQAPAAPAAFSSPPQAQPVPRPQHPPTTPGFSSPPQAQSPGGPAGGPAAPTFSSPAPSPASFLQTGPAPRPQAPAPQPQQAPGAGRPQFSSTPSSSVPHLQAPYPAARPGFSSTPSSQAPGSASGAPSAPEFSDPPSGGPGEAAEGRPRPPEVPGGFSG